MGFPALRADAPQVPWFLCIFALITAMLSARPYAGSWNDGSRLAAVEALGDHDTLAIDDSIFCRPSEADRPPYALDDLVNSLEGTRDKLFIDGHYYSDKPAVVSVLMAGVYKTAKVLGFPSAAQRPDLFCWTLTVVTSGLAYLVCLLALHRLGRLIHLPDGLHFLWLGSFAFSAVALAYIRHVNSSILQLAIVAVVCQQLVALAQSSEGRTLRWIGLGTLAGIGFNLDFGSGPLMVMGLFLLVVVRSAKRKQEVMYFTLACLPWVIAGVGINYVIGGTLIPANMVPEYLSWPGSPFTSDNLTGISRHDPRSLTLYGLAMVFGKKGIVTNNLPLLLLFPALTSGLLRRSSYRTELIFGLGWCLATWLLYTVLSNNYGGVCLSIRWFVPFLAPFWLLLALYLREYPQARFPFLVLSVWGLLLALVMWNGGPWTPLRGAFLWPIVAVALLSCYLCPRHFSRATREFAAKEPTLAFDSRAAA